ncbi:hypothetical protein T11_10260, partial [Trichinella zimbabwensis]
MVHLFVHFTWQVVASPKCSLSLFTTFSYYRS